MFLEKMFEPYLDRASLLVEIRAIRKGGEVERQFFQFCMLEDAVEYCSDLSTRGFDVYYGVCPRLMGDGEVFAAAWLWLDVDAKCGEELIDKAIRECDVAVYSGTGGVHAYWRLDRVVDFRETDPALFRRGCRVWAQENFPGTDAVSDVARILRVPGTFNYKPGGGEVILVKG